MSEIERELSSWRKGKTPLVGKYLTEHRKVFDAIAGRGFLNLPGFAYDMENGLEMALKQNLSELNYKILAETIERELKQAGIDYNNDYAQAVMAWEIEKQGLITAWDSELAGIKRGMAAEEEVMNRLAAEVDARQAVLITAKTAIDTEMEGYRKQLAGLDAKTAPYEVQLANAKLLTAQKKLEIIPIMQGIITKEYSLLNAEHEKATENAKLIGIEQQIAGKDAGIIAVMEEIIDKETELVGVESEKAAEYAELQAIEQQIAGKDEEIIPIMQEILIKEDELLDLEWNKAAEYEALMNAEQEVAAKKQQLIPGMANLATVTEAHAQAVETVQGPLEEQIADEKFAQAEKNNEIDAEKLALTEKQIDTAKSEIELRQAKRDLQKTQIDNELERTNKEITNDTNYQAAVESAAAEIETSDRDASAYIISKKIEVNDIKNETSENSINAVASAQQAAEQNSTGADVYRTEHVAAAQAAAEITAKLTHLIG